MVWWWTASPGTNALLEVMKEMAAPDNHGIHFPDYIGRSEKDLWMDFLSRNTPASRWMNCWQ